MPAKIFINYRRDDVPDGAARVRDGLAAKFGKSNIFMDVDNLLAGQRFASELAKALDACDVLIAVVGPRWMELLKSKAASGDRDYVREEIAAALKRGIVVIPARVGRENNMPALPRPDELPEDIRDLVDFQKHDVSHERFGRDIAELIEAITTVRRSQRPQRAVARVPWGWIGATALSVMAIGYVGAYSVGVPLPWPWSPAGMTAEDTALAKARADDTTTAWVVYLNAHPQGANSALARQRLAELRKAEEDARGKTAVEAKRKSEQEAQQKAEVEAAARRKAESDGSVKAVEIERQKLASLKKEDDDRRQAVAEAKRKAEAEAVEVQRQRIVSLRTEDEERRQAVAKLKADEQAARRIPQPGDTFRDCNDNCPEMVVLRAGRFVMGSHEQWETQPLHTVSIQPFAAGKFEVTFEEWEGCVSGGGCQSNRTPSHYAWGKGRRPVINVSWHDAKEYVSWLSRKTGKSYRVLSEAEWEYAARAGTTTRYPWGNDIGKGNANCDGCGSEWDRRHTAPVGSFKANPFGLHDMHGNVWEWCEDNWHSNYQGAPTDGSVWQGGDSLYRVLRGGAWNYIPGFLRSYSRISVIPVQRDIYAGFRVARSL